MSVDFSSLQLLSPASSRWYWSHTNVLCTGSWSYQRITIILRYGYRCAQHFTGTCLRATEHRLPYWITVLPATRHRWTRPTLTPARQAGTSLTYPRGM